MNVTQFLGNIQCTPHMWSHMHKHKKLSNIESNIEFTYIFTTTFIISQPLPQDGENK